MLFLAKPLTHNSVERSIIYKKEIEETCHFRVPKDKKFPVSSIKIRFSIDEQFEFASKPLLKFLQNLHFAVLREFYITE